MCRRRVIKGLVPGLVPGRPASNGGAGLGIEIALEPIRGCSGLLAASKCYTRTCLDKDDIPQVLTSRFHFALRAPKYRGGEQVENRLTSRLRDDDEFALKAVKIQSLITLNPRNGLLWAVSQKKIF